MSTCTICLDNLNNHVSLKYCSHEFCKNCFDIWSNKSNKCPICRTQIKDTETATNDCINNLYKKFNEIHETCNLLRMLYKTENETDIQIIPNDVQKDKILNIEHNLNKSIAILNDLELLQTNRQGNTIDLGSINIRVDTSGNVFYSGDEDIVNHFIHTNQNNNDSHSSEDSHSSHSEDGFNDFEEDRYNDNDEYEITSSTTTSINTSSNSNVPEIFSLMRQFFDNPRDISFRSSLDEI